MAAALAHELLKRPEVHARSFRGSPTRRRLAISLLESVLFRGVSDFGDRDQGVKPEADVGVLGGEMTIDDDPAELDSEPPARWHAFTAVAGQIHEEPLDPFDGDIDVERRRQVLQLDVHLV